MTQDSFISTLKQNFALPPNKGQDELMIILEVFAKSVKPNELLIIKGYAGTGKTSVLGAFVKTLKTFKIKSKLLAPTGRAAKVFSLKANERAHTIHKEIYRSKSKVDISSGLSLRQNLQKNTIFIVDEASMIGDNSFSTQGQMNSRDLLADLFEYVFSGLNCKLIFLGDEGQLPPVGDDFSPALSEEYVQEKQAGIIIESFALTEVVRQAEDSGILRNATLLRSTKWVDYPRLDVKLGSDIVRVSGEDLQDYLESSYSKYGAEECILITRSNKQANAYNQQIRARILWYEEILCSGDCLMAVKNNYFWLPEDSKMGFIANGELMKVKRINKIEKMHGFEFAHVQVDFVDYESEGEVELIIHTESLTVDGPSLSRSRLKELFFSVEMDYAHIKEKNKRYEAILTDVYFNAVQVKYSYAVTCHKSQGGQWDEVYIDQGYVSKEIMGPDYYRWLYTALTRASRRVYLLNFSDLFFTD